MSLPVTPIFTNVCGANDSRIAAADTYYLASANNDRAKRAAVGVYQQSGLSGYVVENGSLPTNVTQIVGPQGPGFPVNWNPRVSALKSSPCILRSFDCSFSTELSMPSRQDLAVGIADGVQRMELILGLRRKLALTLARTTELCRPDHACQLSPSTAAIMSIRKIRQMDLS